MQLLCVSQLILLALILTFPRVFEHKWGEDVGGKLGGWVPDPPVRGRDGDPPLAPPLGPASWPRYWPRHFYGYKKRGLSQPEGFFRPSKE